MAVQANWCVSFSFRDSKGQVRKITLCYNAEAVASNNLYADFMGATAATVPLLQALSNAHVQSSYDPLPTNPNEYRGYSYGTSSEYQSVAQQAVLSYTLVDNAGIAQAGTGRVTIPAPKLSIFLADGITVDPTNAAVVAFSATLTAASYPLTNAAGLATRDSLLYGNLVGGVFIGRKISRKMNKFVYNPELTVRGI